MINSYRKTIFLSLAAIIVILITLFILYYFGQFLIIAYVVFLLFYGLYSWAAIYHLRAYGYKGDACQLAIYLYSIICLLVVLTSSFLLFA